MRVMDEIAIGGVGLHLGPVTAAPRGRKGLWGALAATVTPPGPGLAVTDMASLARKRSMFDYDPARAVSLDQL